LPPQVGIISNTARRASAASRATRRMSGRASAASRATFTSPAHGIRH